jgi:acetylornithine deacetylase
VWHDDRHLGRCWTGDDAPPKFGAFVACAFVSLDARNVPRVGLPAAGPTERIPMIDTRWVDDVLRGLVRINSVNPSLVPGAPGEAEIAAFTAGLLRDLGLEVDVLESVPGRPSVVGRFAGTGGGRSLMLNAHYDTVGVDGMAEPFSAAIRDGRMYGRGSYDMKASLAACIGAVEALGRTGRRPRGDVLIAAVADEEAASIGTQDVLDSHVTDGAIVTEPTSLRLCLAHKGFVWYRVVTRGRAAHGSRPDLGIDANLHMGRVLARLDGLSWSLGAGRAHPLVGTASLHAATISGGTGLSTYSAECTLGIERRTIPGETESEATTQLRAILDELAAGDARFDATLEVELARDPFEARPGSRIAESLARCAANVLGAEPERIGDSPWMDAAFTTAAGIDTVVFGPHGQGAHAAEEWVDLDSVHRTAAVLAATIIDYCG